jgi:phosphopantetheinyl transferase
MIQMNIEIDRVIANISAILKKPSVSIWEDTINTSVFQSSSISIHFLVADYRVIQWGVDTHKNWLNSEESEEVAGFEKSWRKNQFLLGRILMKRAALDFVGSREIDLDQRDFSIHSSKIEGPTLKIHSDKDNLIPHVSISHKGNSFIAICANTNVGIDIEDLSKVHSGLDHDSISHSYSDKSLVKFVEHVLETAQSTEIKTALWSAREAGFKSMNNQSVESPLQVNLKIKKDSLIAYYDEVEREVLMFKVKDLVYCIAI